MQVGETELSLQCTRMFYDGKGDYCGCLPERGMESPSQCRACAGAGRSKEKPFAVSGCTNCRCSGHCDAPGCPAVITQKRIWKQVRAASSSYVGALRALTVHGGLANRPTKRWNMVNWNQMSDRAVPHVGTAYNASRGNSTRGSLVRHRPGAGGFAGTGVDKKHGSYARYLNRLKAGALKTEKSKCHGKDKNVVKHIRGNKRRKIGMIAESSNHCC